MSGKSSRLSISMLCIVFLVLATSVASQAFSLERIVVLILGEPSTGSRTAKRPASNNGICFISFYQYGQKEFINSNSRYSSSQPDINVPVLSQTPLFIWKGSADSLVIYPKNSSSGSSPSDKQQIPGTVTQIKSAQKLVRRSKNSYYKARLDPSTSLQGETFNFYILNEKEAAEHNARLEEIKKQFASEGEERQALEQAQYLAKNKLFLDVLQKLASIEHPSEEFQEAIAAQAEVWIKEEKYLQAMSAVFPIQNPTSDNLKQLRTQLESKPCFPPEP